ncbi:BOLA class I histocompatibility antigen, alpha chain BL3-6-like isoform X1 [Notamacropus eugenii]|uniref:BOLA class I histocompatibility antigen, alpha chain BL3-6-like isoform X1 n=1 Tax=Notamacropus eugenii TaxID=9315 RepID=UPI003B67B557
MLTMHSLFLLGTLALTQTWAGPRVSGAHTLRYFDTAVYQPDIGEPRFISVGYVDDQQFVHFDSDSASQRVEPRVRWMDKMDQGYWDRETRNMRVTAQDYRVDLQTLRGYYNQGEDGVHTLQGMRGCEVYHNLTFKRGFLHYAYDGYDLFTLDTETYRWTASVPETLDTETYRWTASVPETLNVKRKWEAGRNKDYLEKECVLWLLHYLEMGKEALKRADPPSFRVVHHTVPDGEVTLQCRAQDFYPAEIFLTWLRDGEEQLQDMEFIETRPAGDGTFQKWATVRIISGQEGKYTCRVQHEGLSEPLTLKWEPQSKYTWITLGIIAVFILHLVIAEVVILKNRNSGRQDCKGIIRQQAQCRFWLPLNWQLVFLSLISLFSI